jgi:hypothetical protein
MEVIEQSRELSAGVAWQQNQYAAAAPVGTEPGGDGTVSR